jgi:hypothetical protein
MTSTEILWPAAVAEPNHGPASLIPIDTTQMED